MGIDRILLVLDEVSVAGVSGSDDATLDVFIVVADEGLRGDAAVYLSELRRDGLRADWTVDARSVKAQFKAADKRGARIALVIGEEWANGEVTAKDLDTGEQSVRSNKEIVQWLQAR